jgi:UDP-glucose 4-epimerase
MIRGRQAGAEFTYRRWSGLHIRARLRNLERNMEAVTRSTWSTTGDGRTLAVVGRGFIGGRIARLALRHGWKVRSLTRRATDERVDPGHDLYVGDARQPDQIARLLEGADHVVFSAGTAKPAESNVHPMHEIAANLSPLLATLEGMARASVPAITLISSGGTVYGPDAPTPTPETAPLWPISTYGVLKVAAERYVSLYARQHAMTADILRCANVYGPGEPSHGSQGLIGVTRAALRAHRPVVVYGDGSARRDFVYVDDVAETVVTLAARPDGVRVLNVGSGRSESVLEVIDAVARSLGTTATLEHRPGRSTDVPVVQLDVTRLHELVDLRARSLLEGLAATPS